MSTRSNWIGFACAVCVLLPGGCVREAPDTSLPDGPELLIVQGNVPDTLDMRGIGGLQQAFMRAMTMPGTELGKYVSTNGFIFSDWLAPRPDPVRDLFGRPTQPNSYFSSLNQRIDPDYAKIESMEARHDRGQIVVLTRHPDRQPSITRWQRSADTWKVVMFTINVPDHVTERVLGIGPVSRN